MNTRTIEVGLAATLKSIASEVNRNDRHDERDCRDSSVMRRRLGEMIVSAYSGRTTIAGA